MINFGEFFWEISIPVATTYDTEDTAVPKACQLKAKTLDKSRLYPSPDPPKSPLRRGTLRRVLFPPS